jgi:hypothetical protein
MIAATTTSRGRGVRILVISVIMVGPGAHPAARRGRTDGGATAMIQAS